MPSQDIRQAICSYQRNLEERSHNHRCCGRAIRITYSECIFVDLVIQHEKRLRRIALSSVVICLCHIFLKLCIKSNVCDKLKIIFVFWSSLQILSRAFLIIRRIRWHNAINAHRSSRKVPVTLIRFSWNLTFLVNFSKNADISFKISWQSIQFEPSCFMRTERLTDGRTEITKLIVAFRNFSIKPKL
jgi:hypothetical protein